MMNRYGNVLPFGLNLAQFTGDLRGLSPQLVGVYILMTCYALANRGVVTIRRQDLAGNSAYYGMREVTFKKVVDRLIALGKLHKLGFDYQPNLVRLINFELEKRKSNKGEQYLVEEEEMVDAPQSAAPIQEEGEAAVATGTFQDESETYADDQAVAGNADGQDTPLGDPEALEARGIEILQTNAMARQREKELGKDEYFFEDEAKYSEGPRKRREKFLHELEMKYYETLGILSGTADIDNRLKAMLDVIVKARVIEDDRFVTAIAVSWLPPANGLSHVSIYPVQHLTLDFHPSQSGTCGGWFENCATHS